MIVAVPRHHVAHEGVEVAAGLRVLAALRPVPDDVLEARAGPQRRFAEGVERAVAAVAGDEAVVAVPHHEAVRHGLDGVLQHPVSAVARRLKLVVDAPPRQQSRGRREEQRLDEAGHRDDAGAVARPIREGLRGLQRHRHCDVAVQGGPRRRQDGAVPGAGREGEGPVVALPHADPLGQDPAGGEFVVRQARQQPPVRALERHPLPGRVARLGEQALHGGERHLGHGHELALARQRDGAGEVEHPLARAPVVGRAGQGHHAPAAVRDRFVEREAGRAGAGRRPQRAVAPHQHQVAEGEALHVEAAQEPARPFGRDRPRRRGQRREQDRQARERAVDLQELPVDRVGQGLGGALDRALRRHPDGLVGLLQQEDAAPEQRAGHQRDDAQHRQDEAPRQPGAGRLSAHRPGSRSWRRARRSRRRRNRGRSARSSPAAPGAGGGAGGAPRPPR